MTEISNKQRKLEFMKTSTSRNSFLLVLTAFIWGIAFVAQSKGGHAVGPYTFNCIRSFIGGMILIPAIHLLDLAQLTSRRPSNHAGEKPLIVGGITCGAVLFVASSLQQLGLYYGSSAGKAGFLTACYIILVPILGIFVKKKCPLSVWISVGITVMGLYLLCVKESLSFQFSDVLLLLCALGFAIHIIVIDHFSPLVDGVRMSCIQFFVCGFLSMIPMFFVDMKHSMAGISAWAPAFSHLDSWIPILYAGILSCGVAYTLQIIGQQGVNPTIASLLMSLESVFSVMAGWVLLGETMNLRELAGCLLIFAAVIFAQIPVSSIKKQLTCQECQE